MTSVLLTGASGFIGRRVAQMLTEASFAVTAIGRTDPGIAGLTFINADLSDEASMRAVEPSLHTVEHVIHLAAAIPSASIPSDPVDAMRIANVKSTELLLSVLPPTVRQFVFASTLDVYGEPKTFPLTEDHPLEPITAYAQSKKEAELLLQQECKARGLRLCTLRLTQIYGPGEAPVKAIPRFLHTIAAGTAPVLYGDGSDLRDYLFVDDAARAFVLAVQKNAEGTINIASGTSVSIKQVLDILLRLSGSALRPELRDRQKPKLDFGFDLTKAKTLLGFAPTVTINDGLRTYWNAVSPSAL